MDSIVCLLGKGIHNFVSRSLKQTPSAWSACCNKFRGFHGLRVLKVLLASSPLVIVLNLDIIHRWWSRCKRCCWAGWGCRGWIKMRILVLQARTEAVSGRRGCWGRLCSAYLCEASIWAWICIIDLGAEALGLMQFGWRVGWGWAEAGWGRGIDLDLSCQVGCRVPVGRLAAQPSVEEAAAMAARAALIGFVSSEWPLGLRI